MKLSRYYQDIILHLLVFPLIFSLISCVAVPDHKLAREAIDRGDYKSALIHLQRAQKQYPSLEQKRAFKEDLSRSRVALFQEYMEAGRQLLRQGRWKEAQSTFSILIEFVPDSHEAENMAKYASARYAMSQGQWKYALSLLNELPQSRAYSELTDIIRLVRDKLAIQACEDGKSFLSRGRLTDARERFQNALAYCPTQVEAKTYLSYIKARELMKAKEWDHALKIISKLEKQNSSLLDIQLLRRKCKEQLRLSSSLMQQAILQVRAERYRNALVRILAAFEVFPHIKHGEKIKFSIFMGLGKQMESASKYGCAWAWYRHLLRQNSPWNEEIKVSIEDLHHKLRNKLQKVVSIETTPESKDQKLPLAILESVRNVLEKESIKYHTFVINEAKDRVSDRCVLSKLSESVSVNSSPVEREHKYQSSRRKVLSHEYRRALEDVEDAERNFERTKLEERQYMRELRSNRSNRDWYRSSAEDSRRRVEEAHQELKEAKSRKWHYWWHKKYEYEPVYSTAKYTRWEYTKTALCNFQVELFEYDKKKLFSRTLSGKASSSDTLVKGNSDISLTADPLSLPEDKVLLTRSLSDAAQKAAEIVTTFFRQRGLEYVTLARSFIKQEKSFEAIEQYALFLTNPSCVEANPSLVKEAEDFLSIHSKNLFHLVPLLDDADIMPTQESRPTIVTELVTSRKYWAVVIGVSHYSDNRIIPIQFAVEDAKSVYQWLIDPDGGGYAKENVILLLDDKATLRAFRQTFFSWLQQPSEKDVVTIYLACHGAPERTGDIQNVYLLPHDANYDDLASTAFPMWDIKTAIERFVKSENLFVIADTCNSGSIRTGVEITSRSPDRSIKVSPVTEYLKEVTNLASGVVLFASADQDQFSQESTKWGGGHGVFTFFILKALAGEADINGDGRVTLGELFPFVSERVKRETKGEQEPVVSGRFDPTFSIKRR